MAADFKGHGVALVTPFHKHGTVDFTSFGNIIEHIISGGVDFVVALGTTSESATLTEKERLAVTDFIVDTVDKRVPVVLGLGGNSTQNLVELIKKTNFDGIDAILSVAPYYNIPQQDGLFYHYKNVNDVSPVPVIVYNIPKRTGVCIKSETMVRIANELDQVIAVKDAAADIILTMDVVKNCKPGFSVLSGDDQLTLPIMAMGGHGVISVTGNAFPAEMTQMVRFAQNGDFENARKIHYKLQPVFQALFADGNPAGIKAALEILGMCSNNLRLPLVKVKPDVYQRIQMVIADFQK